MRIAFLIGGVALAVAIIAVFQYGREWFAEDEVPAVVVVLEQLAAFDLPGLWLDREDLIRRLAVVIDNAPRGEYPRRQLGFLAPTGKFQVVERGEQLFVDPLSYSRFDIYLDLLENIEPQALADTLSLFQPLVSESLTELGNQQSMATQIHVAISRITELPELPEQVELVQPKVFYEYADPDLEALSPLQKQVLRMGPVNVHRLQVYLRALQVALAANETGG
jgi:hypothetical protein